MKRVIVQLIYEDAVHQWFRMGELTAEEFNSVKQFFESGPMNREDTIRDDPFSLESQVLQKMFRYYRDGDRYIEDHNEVVAFKPVDAEEVMKEPCYLLVLYGNE